MGVIVLIIPLLLFLHLFYLPAWLRADCQHYGSQPGIMDIHFPTLNEVSGASEGLCSCVRNPGTGRLMASVTQGRGEGGGLACQGEIEVAGRSCQTLVDAPAVGLGPDQGNKNKSY